MSTAVDPGTLPGQLTLDLPGLAAPAERPVPRRRARPAAEELPAALPVPAVPPRVWGVWDGEDLVGVYAEEQVARADAAVLQRDAVRAGVRASTIDCLAVPVLTATQHQRRPRRARELKVACAASLSSSVTSAKICSAPLPRLGWK